MQTENDTPKPETELKQEAGEGCPGATCSPSDTIYFVRRFNSWRQGGVELNENEFKRISVALDAVCKLAEKYRNTLEDIYTGHILRGAVQEKIEEALNFNAENDQREGPPDSGTPQQQKGN